MCGITVSKCTSLPEFNKKSVANLANGDVPISERFLIEETTDIDYRITGMGNCLIIMGADQIRLMSLCIMLATDVNKV